MRHRLVFLFVGAAMSVAAREPNPFGSGREGAGYSSNYEDEAPWQEQQDVKPPAFPRQENLHEFYVGVAATNKYFIDATTLVVGPDGVVRYVLVVKTSGGATNTSFEGIHCQQRSWKHYATGGSDGTWTKSRATRIEWRPIENKPVNGHHAALSRNLFCPAGTAISTADDGRNALRLGKHPNSN